MYVAKYELQKTLCVSVGKYSFRDFYPRNLPRYLPRYLRAFYPVKRRKATYQENISHIDGTMYPIVDIFHWKNFFGFLVPDDWSEESCYEVFISSNDWSDDIVTKQAQAFVDVNTAKCMLLQCTSYKDDF